MCVRVSLLCVRVHVRVRVRGYVCVRAYVRASRWVHVRARLRVRVRVCMCVCVVRVHMCLCVYCVRIVCVSCTCMCASIVCECMCARACGRRRLPSPLAPIGVQLLACSALTCRVEWGLSTGRRGQGVVPLGSSCDFSSEPGFPTKNVGEPQSKHTNLFGIEPAES